MANAKQKRKKKNVENTPEKPPPVKRTKERSRIVAGGGRSNTSSSPPSVLEGLPIMKRRARPLVVDEDDVNGGEDDNGGEDNIGEYNGNGENGDKNGEEDNIGKEDNNGEEDSNDEEDSNGEDNDGEDNGDDSQHEEDSTGAGGVAVVSTGAAGSGMFCLLILVCLIVAILPLTMLAFVQVLPCWLETEIESTGRMENQSMLWIVYRGLLRIICSER